jgi:hypothetical protein
VTSYLDLKRLFISELRIKLVFPWGIHDISGFFNNLNMFHKKKESIMLELIKIPKVIIKRTSLNVTLFLFLSFLIFIYFFVAFVEYELLWLPYLSEMEHSARFCIIIGVLICLFISIVITHNNKRFFKIND